MSQKRLTIDVKLLLSANRKSYMPRRLACTTTDDLEWPQMAVSRFVSTDCIWRGVLYVNALCTSSTLKSPSSASRAISAVAELLINCLIFGPSLKPPSFDMQLMICPYFWMICAILYLPTMRHSKSNWVCLKFVNFCALLWIYVDFLKHQPVGILMRAENHRKLPLVHVHWRKGWKYDALRPFFIIYARFMRMKTFIQTKMGLSKGVRNLLLLSRLHAMGRGNTKVAVCRRLLLSKRLVFVAFCCLCAVHCMQAAAASFVSPNAVSIACTICSWTAKIALRMHWKSTFLD